MVRRTPRRPVSVADERRTRSNPSPPAGASVIHDVKQPTLRPSRRSGATVASRALRPFVVVLGDRRSGRKPITCDRCPRGSEAPRSAGADRRTVASPSLASRHAGREREGHAGTPGEASRAQSRRALASRRFAAALTIPGPSSGHSAERRDLRGRPGASYKPARGCRSLLRLLVCLRTTPSASGMTTSTTKARLNTRKKVSIFGKKVRKSRIAKIRSAYPQLRVRISRKMQYSGWQFGARPAN